MLAHPAILRHGIAVVAVAVAAAVAVGGAATGSAARSGRRPANCAPRNALIVKAGREGIAYLLLDAHGHPKRPSTLYGCLRPHGRRYVLSDPRDDNRPLPPPAIAFNGPLIVYAIAASPPPNSDFGIAETDLRTGKDIVVDASNVPTKIVVKADGAFAYVSCINAGDRPPPGFDYGPCRVREPMGVIVYDHRPGSRRLVAELNPQPLPDTDKPSSLRLAGSRVSWLFEGQRYSYPIR